MKNGFVIVGLGIAFFLSGIDMSAFNLALVWIQSDLSLSLAATDWVIGSYLLSFAAFLIVFGRLGDIYGHKKFFLWGLLLFALATFLGGFSETGTQMIWARGFQGVGAAMFWPSVQPIVMHSFPKKKTAFILGLIMGIGGVGMAGGPFFTGLILQYFSWRYVFWLNIPLCFLSFILIAIFLSKEQLLPKRQKMDWAGIVFLVCFCFSLTYAIDLGGRYGFANRYVLSFVAASLGIAWLFVVREDNTDNPLVDLTLFANPKFLIGVVFRSTMGFTFFTILFFTGYALQHIAQLRADLAGLYFLPFTGAFALMAILGGYISTRIGNSLVMYTGMWSMALGAVSFGIIILYTLNFLRLYVLDGKIKSWTSHKCTCNHNRNGRENQESHVYNPCSRPPVMFR